MHEGVNVYHLSDVMRQHPTRPLSAEEQDLIDQVKQYGQRFHEKLDSLGGSRSLSVAKTKLEEAVMWAVKHITQ